MKTNRLLLALLICFSISGCSLFKPKYKQADLVVIHKKEHKLELVKSGIAFAKYPVQLGPALGPKCCKNDARTPEGVYYIDWRHPRSHYYKALHISYPNPQDLARAKRLGIHPGNNIEIHGWGNIPSRLENWYSEHDWTLGCIALKNKHMEIVWNSVPVGTPVKIVA